MLAKNVYADRFIFDRPSVCPATRTDMQGP